MLGDDEEVSLPSEVLMVEVDAELLMPLRELVMLLDWRLHTVDPRLSP